MGVRGEPLDGGRFPVERRANLGSPRTALEDGAGHLAAVRLHDLASDHIFGPVIATLHVWKTRGCRGHGLAV